MKKIYWRPHRVSRIELVLIVILAISGIFLVETMLVREQQPYYQDKIASTKLAREAMEVIKAERLKKGKKIDKEADPAESGMIGVLMSEVTTNSGHLPAKQTSINPNFAGVIVHMLRRAGVENGDTVAVGCSGSFPALNVATFAALETLQTNPIVISSVSGSQWGANIQKLLWVDMETILYKLKIFKFRSVAASRGGVDDRALGLSKKGKEMLDDAIERNELIPIQEKNYEDSLIRRMQIYEEFAGETPIKAYINVGGGAISVGTAAGKKLFHPGLNKSVPRTPLTVDSVIGRFAYQGIPVVHLVSIDRIAERYGLPMQPNAIPPIGEGNIYYREGYNDWLPPVVLIIILATMVAFIRYDWGFRMMQSSHGSKNRKPPEQMV